MKELTFQGINGWNLAMFFCGDEGMYYTNTEILFPLWTTEEEVRKKITNANQLVLQGRTHRDDTIGTPIKKGEYKLVAS